MRRVIKGGNVWVEINDEHMVTLVATVIVAGIGGNQTGAPGI
jgi:hypothetical protein